MLKLAATLFATVILPGAVLIASAQETKAPLSPPAHTSATIDGKKVSIDYSSPRMRGRKIMGELVPYDKVWRAGANSATKFVTEADLDINGLKVPKGEYTIYAIPSESEWTLIVNKETGQWGTEYNESKDLGRIKMSVSKTSSPVEDFKIELSSAGGNKGELTMTWENTKASVPFTIAD